MVARGGAQRNPWRATDEHGSPVRGGGQPACKTRCSMLRRTSSSARRRSCTPTRARLRKRSVSSEASPQAVRASRLRARSVNRPSPPNSTPRLMPTGHRLQRSSGRPTASRRPTRLERASRALRSICAAAERSWASTSPNPTWHSRRSPARPQSRASSPCSRAGSPSSQRPSSDSHRPAAATRGSEDRGSGAPAPAGSFPEGTAAA